MASCVSCSLVVKVIYEIDDIENIVHSKAKLKVETKPSEELIKN